MGYYGKEYRKRILLGQSGNALMTLIAIQLCVFIIFAFIKVVYRFQYPDADAAVAAYNKNILDWFILPANLHKLGTRPWTILTHMFMHDGLWHILGNML